MKRVLVMLALVAAPVGLLACLHGAARRPLGPAGRFQVPPSDPACLQRAAGVAPTPQFTPEDPPITVRTCDGQQVFETAGETPVSEAQLTALNARIGPALVGLPGVQGIGMGGCCAATAGTANAMCLHVYLSLCTTPIEDLVRKIAAAAHEDGLDGLRLTIGAQIGGPTGPRCARNDPACQPEGYSGVTYRPDRGRHTVHDQIPDLGILSGGTCDYDGECVRAGCGNHCIPWHASGFAGTCEAYTAFEPALCGCVEQQCTWFTQ